MPVVNFKLHSALAPKIVMTALTDFGPSRAEVWPNVDSAHFKVHDQVPGWADVTEGKWVAGGVWERGAIQVGCRHGHGGDRNS
jgi:hypothetical protein